MDIKEYLVQQGNNIVETFRDIKIRISYNSMADIHFIEVHPKSKYNDDVKLFVSYILDDFYEIFPDDSLAFVTSEDLVEGQKNDNWIQGENFKVDWSIWFNMNKIEDSKQQITENDYCLVA